MMGKYTYDDCTVTDPTVTIYSIGVNMENGQTDCEVNMQGEDDGATWFFSSDTQPTSWTTEDVQIWVEDYLQRYRD